MTFRPTKRFFILLTVSLAFIAVKSQAISAESVETYQNYHPTFSLVEKYTFIEEVQYVEKIERFLQKSVPGMDVSYREVINAVVEEGYDLWLIGGVIRDLISNPPSEPHDVDFAFGCSLEELQRILDDHGWMYTLPPGYPVIKIGSRDGAFMEGLTSKYSLEGGENALEFTVNSVFYHCNTKTFVRETKRGLDDIKRKRIKIFAKNWNKWLHRGTRFDNYKLFRFWKMVGKWYSFSPKLGQFFREEALIERIKGPEEFQQVLLKYLGSHFDSFDQLVRGCTVVMGKQWCEENLEILRDEACSVDKEKDAYYATYTYNVVLEKSISPHISQIIR